MNNTDAVLMHMTECTLATIWMMARNRKRIQREYERQISIAQTAISFIASDPKRFLQFNARRVRTVLNIPGASVEKWAAVHDIKMQRA